MSFLNIQNFSDNKKLLLPVVASILLLLLKNFVFPGLNQYLIIGILILFAVRLPYDKCKSFLIFLIPMSCAFNGFLISFLYLMLVFKSKKNTLSPFFPALLLLLVELFHLSNSIGTNYLHFASYLLCFFYLLYDKNKDVHFETSIRLFCISATSVLLIVSIKMIEMYGLVESISGLHRDGSIIGGSEEDGFVLGIALNANSLAYISLVLLSSAILLYGKKIISSIELSTYVIVGLLSGMIAMSRTWLLLVLLIVFLYVRSYMRNSKSSLFRFLLIGVVIFVVMANYIDFSAVTEGFVLRFSADDMESAGNRTNNFNAYMNYMNTHPSSYLWGAGLLDISTNTGISASPHNAILQILVSYGFIGLLVFFIAGSLFYNKYKSITKEIEQYVPLFVALVEIQTIQFLSPYFLMLPLAYTCCIVKQKIES